MRIVWCLQIRGEQLAEEHAELVALRHELNQKDRELSRRATEQATEAANTQVLHCLLHFALGPVTMTCLQTLACLQWPSLLVVNARYSTCR